MNHLHDRTGDRPKTGGRWHTLCGREDPITIGCSHKEVYRPRYTRGFWLVSITPPIHLLLRRRHPLDGKGRKHPWLWIAQKGYDRR